MAPLPRLWARWARLLATVAALLAAGDGFAQGLGLSAYAEVGYSSTDLTATDATGRAIHQSGTFVPQRYRLALDQKLYPLAALVAVGSFDWSPGWQELAGAWSKIDATRWSVDLRLILGGPVLNITPFFWQREQAVSSQPADLPATSIGQVGQSFGVNAAWSPDSWPALTLTLSRSEFHDWARIALDRAENIVLFNANYLDLEVFQFRYAARLVNSNDRLNALLTTDFRQSAQVTWSDSFLERRITTYLNYQVELGTTWIDSSGGGIILSQRFPLTGLSAVENFPSVPTRVTLSPNPALIDGNVLASAGIDIGTQPSASGDTNYRDVGAQLADAFVPVNTFYVWVDRPLPGAVSAAYDWQAFESDDNANWVVLPLAGPTVFNGVLNRFEITTARSRYRYVKVTTRPLPLAASPDPLYANVFVTEIQLFDAIPASEAPRSLSRMYGNLNASARVVLLGTPSLAWDFSAYASHGDAIFELQTWNVTNGLTYSQRLGSILGVTARVQHTDMEQGSGFLLINQWSAQLSADPLPTLGGSFTYSGIHQVIPEGTFLTNSLSLFGRADLYEGLSLALSLGYSVVAGPALSFSAPNATATVTVTPMRQLTLTGGYVLGGVGRSAGSQAPVQDTTQAIQGQVTFTPIPALFLSGGSQRYIGFGREPATLNNLSVGINPFPDGQLLLRFAYFENTNGGAASVNRVYGPSLRWNIRTGAFVEASYTWNSNRQPALTTQQNTFFAQLNIVFR